MTRRTPGRKPQGDTTPDALYFHCLSVYDKMFEYADERTSDEGTKYIVYEGNLTSLVLKDCNLSTPYYTSVTQALRGMKCIRQLKRGGGTSPSMWEMLQRPTLEGFQTFKPPRKKASGPMDQMQYQIDQLDARLKVIEDVFQKVISSEGEIMVEEEEDGPFYCSHPSCQGHDTNKEACA